MVSDFVFLMRHAGHDRGKLTEPGVRGVVDVAGRLAEWLDGRALEVFVEYTAATEVKVTARVLFEETAKELRRLRAASDRIMLAPEDESSEDKSCDVETGAGLQLTLREGRIELGPYRPERERFCEVVCWLKKTAAEDGRAPLLVGNDPLVGWLAGELVCDEVPVRRGELVCLRRTRVFSWRKGWVDGWRVGWTIFADEDVPAIVAKIESKMNTAKVLGAVITGLLVFLLKEGLSDGSGVFDWLAFLAFGTAAAGYFGSLFLYDSLLLPSGFWGSEFPQEPHGSRLVGAGWERVRYGRPGLERPPSPTDRMLQQAMVQVWNSLFRPATWLVGFGVGFLALSARFPDVGTGHLTDTNTAVVLVVWVVIWPTALVIWIRASRPRLGASD